MLHTLVKGGNGGYICGSKVVGKHRLDLWEKVSLILICRIRYVSRHLLRSREKGVLGLSAWTVAASGSSVPHPFRLTCERCLTFEKRGRMQREPRGLDEALPGGEPLPKGTMEVHAAPSQEGQPLPKGTMQGRPRRLEEEGWSPGVRLETSDPASLWRQMRNHMRQQSNTNHAGRRQGSGTTSKARQARRASEREEKRGWETDSWSWSSWGWTEGSWWGWQQRPWEEHSWQEGDWHRRHEERSSFAKRRGRSRSTSRSCSVEWRKKEEERKAWHRASESEAQMDSEEPGPFTQMLQELRQARGKQSSSECTGASSSDAELASRKLVAKGSKQPKLAACNEDAPLEPGHGSDETKATSAEKAPLEKGNGKDEVMANAPEPVPVEQLDVKDETMANATEQEAVEKCGDKNETLATAPQHVPLEKGDARDETMGNAPDNVTVETGYAKDRPQAKAAPEWLWRQGDGKDASVAALLDPLPLVEGHGEKESVASTPEISTFGAGRGHGGQHGRSF